MPMYIKTIVQSSTYWTHIYLRMKLCMCMRISACVCACHVFSPTDSYNTPMRVLNILTYTHNTGQRFGGSSSGKFGLGDIVGCGCTSSSPPPPTTFTLTLILSLSIIFPLSFFLPTLPWHPQNISCTHDSTSSFLSPSLSPAWSICLKPPPPRPSPLPPLSFLTFARPRLLHWLLFSFKQTHTHVSLIFKYQVRWKQPRHVFHAQWSATRFF